MDDDADEPPSLSPNAERLRDLLRRANHAPPDVRTIAAYVAGSRVVLTRLTGADAEWPALAAPGWQVTIE